MIQIKRNSKSNMDYLFVMCMLLCFVVLLPLLLRGGLLEETEEGE